MAATTDYNVFDESTQSWKTVSAAMQSTPTASKAAVDKVVGDTTLNTPVKAEKDVEGAVTQNEGILSKIGGFISGLFHSETQQNTSSPATTPAAKAPSSEPVPDAYRKGLGQDNSVSTEIDLARSLGSSPDTPGSISVTSRIFQQAGKAAKVVDTYARFFLENAVVADQEKYQITETFTSFYVFFFGRRPRVYRYTGYLLNDENHRWLNDFLFYYENFFRGTKAAELDADVVFTYDSNVVSGVLLDFNAQTAAPNPKGVPFAMDVLVLKHDTTAFSLDIADMIERRKKDLNDVKQIIAEQLAMINRNIPSTSQLVARQVLAGKRAPRGPRLAKKKITIPTPTQASLTLQQDNYLKQQTELTALGKIAVGAG